MIFFRKILKIILVPSACGLKVRTSWNLSPLASFTLLLKNAIFKKFKLTTSFGNKAVFIRVVNCSIFVCRVIKYFWVAWKRYDYNSTIKPVYSTSWLNLITQFRFAKQFHVNTRNGLKQIYTNKQVP